MDPANSNFPSATNDCDGKSKNTKFHKASVKSYASRVFEESTIGIVSSIFTTHSKCRRLFRVFLSSLCVAGFTYHCTTFLNHVLEYPEVVNVYVDRSKTYNMPAYTYCSNNAIRRSVFCSLEPRHCVVPSEEFCKKFSSYCGANATLIPKENYYYELPNNFRAAWMLKFGGVPNVLNTSDSYILQKNYEYEDYEISGPYLRSFSNFYESKACYSIHSSVESNLQPLQKIRFENAGSTMRSDEVLHFHLNETEMMNPRNEPGIYFSVHSPFEAVNPLTKGIFMKGGKTYDLYVEMQEEVLLKAPFESNCLDYEELWEKNNRTGPRTIRMCKQKCRLDQTRIWSRCANFDCFYPHKEMICHDHPRYYNYSGPPGENMYLFYDNCCLKCRDECRLLKYTTEVSVQDRVRLVKPEEIHRRIHVNIYMSNEPFKVLRHAPKYETVDVISSVGGFMGCWLGIALMDILDVFGSIITICGYTFRKRL